MFKKISLFTLSIVSGICGLISILSIAACSYHIIRLMYMVSIQRSKIVESDFIPIPAYFFSLCLFGLFTFGLDDFRDHIKNGGTLLNGLKDNK